MRVAEHDFDRAVALEQTGQGLFAGTVTDRWNIGTVPNGGYLVTVVLDAVRRGLPHPDPFSVSAHFPARTEPGPVEVAVEQIRAGRQHSTALARLLQDGRPRIVLTATYGDLGAARGETVVQAQPPEMPPPEACIRAEQPVAPVFVQNFDLRLTPESAGWAIGQPSGRGEMAGWIRFVDGRPPDTASLPLMADAFPPPVLNVVGSPWVPTLELTVHVRARPVDGWLRCRFTTRFLMQGYLEEDGEIWDESGTLVAQSRQLARVRAG
jgi:acyl-CoA thioesterase